MHPGGLIDPDLALGLMEAPDGDSFAMRLLQIAQTVSGVEELFAYCLEAETPRVLASSSRLGNVAERADAYAKRFHHSDPLGALNASTPPGNGFVHRFAAQSISRGEYRRLCFERPCFAEKICFGWRKSEQSIVLSFYRREGDREPDMAQLGVLAQLAITGLARLAQRPLPMLPQIEHRLAQAHPSLTPREREVCARSLAGRTARQIGEDLALGIGTVLTYRQRAYQKLGCSKSSDLLASVMR
jgi:DNA-binding CsgD family transcriptional regulator